MKKCPYCAEEVVEEAVKCKYCGEWINSKHQPVISSTSSEEKIKGAFEKRLNTQKTNLQIGIFLQYLWLIINHLAVKTALPSNAYNNKISGAIILTALVVSVMYTYKLSVSLKLRIISRIVLCILIIFPFVNAFVMVYLSEKTKRKIEEIKNLVKRESFNTPSV